MDDTVMWGTEFDDLPGNLDAVLRCLECRILHVGAHKCLVYVTSIKWCEKR